MSGRGVVCTPRSTNGRDSTGCRSASVIGSNWSNILQRGSNHVNEKSKD